MSHLVQLVIKLGLLTLLLGYKHGANISFNDWFLLNTELIQPFGEIAFEAASVYRKGKCFFNKLLRSGSLGLYFFMSSTFWLTWLFQLVDFCIACCLDKVETCANYKWFKVSSNKVILIFYWPGIKFLISITNASQR